MLELRNVCAGYGKKEVLHGIDLEIPDSSIFTIIGHNGCGKTTLLRTMLGFLPMMKGEISLDGLSIGKASPQEVAKHAAYLPQMHTGAEITVKRLVLHGRFPYLHYPRRYRKEDCEAAEAAMEKMNLTEYADCFLGELSGGLQQKAYIAMALAQNASVLVMDEPTTFLDVGQQLQLADLLKALAGEGKTVVLVLHDLLTAFAISRRIAALQDGKILFCGTPEELLEAKIPEKVCGVSMGKVQTADGIHYYYGRKL